MTDRLAVHLYGAHVADVLDAGDGLCAIAYTDAGRRAGAPARLSLSLPVREALHPAVGPAGRWVRALLPEGGALDALVQLAQVPADDPFALLSVVGADVAGAAMILRPEESAALPEARYDPMSAAEVATAIGRLAEVPLGADVERGVRLSLAGVQDKLLLHRPSRRSRYTRPLGGAPSTVILKPQPPPERQLPGLPSNELFCLQLARHAGLNVASARVEVFGSVATLAVRRFDRTMRDAGFPGRVHQEDLLMALGRDHRHKYEYPQAMVSPALGGFAERRPVRHDPGPGLRDLAELLTTHIGMAVLVPFLRRLVVNVAVGNADAHARNHSLLLPADGHVVLAPVYDVVSTVAYPHLPTEPAQDVGGVDDINEITAGDLVAEAASWGVPEGVAARTVNTVLDRLADPDAPAARTVRMGGDPDVVGPLAALARDRAQRLKRSSQG